MRLQIDTTHKTITPLESINIGELLNALAKLFPEEGFREYKLIMKEPDNTLNIPWINPVQVPYSQPYVAPWQQSPIVYGGGTTQLYDGSNTLTNNVADAKYMVSKSSVYNIELLDVPRN